MRWTSKPINLITIVQPGMLTTIQDHGRAGLRNQGIAVCGAMDPWSLSMVNLLLDNNPDTAVLEVTAGGLVLDVHGKILFTVVGGVPQLSVNGRSIRHSRVYWAKSGDRISLGPMEKGFRSYFGVHGGFSLPIVMGSASTDIKNGLGHPHLKNGDKLLCRIGDLPEGLCGRSLNDEALIIPERTQRIRVTEGVDMHHFSRKSMRFFFEEAFRVLPQSDRTGYRLKGPRISWKKRKDILSSGIDIGTVQVPSDGNPIVCMADAPATGGYPRIAQIIQADLPYVAQIQPGQSIRFSRIEVNEAQAIWKNHLRRLERIKRDFQQQKENSRQYRRWFHIQLNGIRHEIGILE